MEDFKKPIGLLTMGNSAAIVASFIHLKSQIESIRTDVDKIKVAMQSVATHYSESRKVEDSNKESLNNLSEEIKKLDTSVITDKVDDIETDLEAMIDILNENNITVERPSQRRYRRSSRRESSRREDSFRDETPIRRRDKVPAPAAADEDAELIKRMRDKKRVTSPQ